MSTQNNMLGSPLINALISDFAATAVALGTLSGSVTINYVSGHFQTVTTAAPITLAFTNWPSAGQAGVVSVQVTVSNVTHTVTLPSSVTTNNVGIVGLATSTNTISFAAVGIYTFTFTTTDGGTTVAVTETNKALQPFNGSSNSVVDGAPSGLTTTTSYFTSAGTSTLAAGVSGTVKVLTQTFAGSMVVTVASPGWTGSGTVTLASKGAGCTLQFTNGAWYCIGNNNCTFA